MNSENIFTYKTTTLSSKLQDIKNGIKELDDTVPWLPQATDLIPEYFKIARMLVQEFEYGIPNGHVKTPKSILLPTSFSCQQVRIYKCYQ